MWMEIGHWDKYNRQSMRLIAHSCHISNAHQGFQLKGQHTRAWLAGHLNDVLACFELTDSCFLGIQTDNGSAN
jgi:hypothetical protein